MNGSNSVLVEMSIEDAVQWFESRGTAPTSESESTVDVPAPEELVPVGGNSRWSREDLAKIRSWISLNNSIPDPGQSYRGLFALMQLTAEADGDWVTKSSAETAAGVSARQLANELSALTKLGKKFKGSNVWPIEYRKVGRTFSYRMDPTLGAWWLALATD